jgi:enoyl-CoA hydratase/carnithine racemase
MGELSVQVSEQGVARIGMASGKANAITDATIQALTEAVVGLRVQADKGEVKCVVLASDRARFFSPGFDLFGLLNKDRAGLYAFGEAFGALCEALLALPVYTVADMRGHAIAGGAVLSLCCDERLMMAAPGATWGLNEVAIGLPLPASLVELLRYRVAAQHVFEIAYGAARYGVDEAAALGVVRAHAEADYEEALAARIQKYVAVSGRAFRIAKAAGQKPLLGVFAAWRGESKALFDGLSADPELQAQLSASLPKRSGG